MENTLNNEIDLVSIDWNNLSKETFNSIYGQLSERNTGVKSKSKAKSKVIPSKRTQISFDGKYYMVLIHQLKKYESIIDLVEKEEYKKNIISCAEIVEIEEF